MDSKFYRTPPPDHALIRAGHGGFKTAVGKGMFVIPVIHLSTVLSLAPIRIDLMGAELDSEPAHSNLLPNVFQVAVGKDHDMILLAAQRLSPMPTESIILLVTDIIIDEFERFLAQADDGSSQDSPASQFTDGVEEALNTVGLTTIASRRY